jgi:hypothetical protein
MLFFVVRLLVFNDTVLVRESMSEPYDFYGYADDCRRGLSSPMQALSLMSAEPHRLLRWSELYSMCRGMLRGDIVDEISRIVGPIASSHAEFMWMNRPKTSYPDNAVAFCTVSTDIIAVVYFQDAVFIVRIFKAGSLSLYLRLISPGLGDRDAMQFQVGCINFYDDGVFKSVAMKSWKKNQGDSFDCTIDDIEEIRNIGAIRVYWSYATEPVFHILEEVKGGDTRYVVMGNEVLKFAKAMQIRSPVPLINGEYPTNQTWRPYRKNGL